MRKVKDASKERVEPCAPTCDACRAEISETQQALSRMRYDDAPRMCKDCVTAENMRIKTANQEDL